MATEKYDIQLSEYSSYSSDGRDSITTISVNGKKHTLYQIETDLSRVDLVQCYDIVYQRVTAYGSSEFSYYGDWVSSDGSVPPEWLSVLEELI